MGFWNRLFGGPRQDADDTVKPTRSTGSANRLTQGQGPLRNPSSEPAAPPQRETAGRRVGMTTPEYAAENRRPSPRRSGSTPAKPLTVASAEKTAYNNFKPATRDWSYTGDRTKAPKESADPTKLPHDQDYYDNIRAKDKREFDLRMGGSSTTRELTDTEYLALSPQQRAAVDANTDLSRAVTEDQSARDADSSLTGDAEYDKSVEAMFGETGGSALFSPRTMAVLDALGLKDRTTDDLDNYLNLSGLVTEDDLQFISGEKAPTSSDNMRQANAMQFSEYAVKSLAATLQQGQGLIESLQATEKGSALFGAPTAAPGYSGDEEMNGFLAQGFETMLDRNSGYSPEQAMTDLSLFSEETGMAMSQIQDYFDTRLSQAEYDTTLGNPSMLGNDSTKQYFDPAEFRSRYYTGGN